MSLDGKRRLYCATMLEKKDKSRRSLIVVPVQDLEQGANKKNMAEKGTIRFRVHLDFYT